MLLLVVKLSLDRNLSDKNVYHNLYTSKELPLDGDFAGDDYDGPVYKHGVTNDIKELWKKSGEEMKRFNKDAGLLHRALLNENLVSRPQHRDNNKGKKVVQRNKKKGPRKPSTRRANAATNAFGSNAHLRGTALERVLAESSKVLLDESNKILR